MSGPKMSFSNDSYNKVAKMFIESKILYMFDYSKVWLQRQHYQLYWKLANSIKKVEEEWPKNEILMTFITKWPKCFEN